MDPLPNLDLLASYMKAKYWVGKRPVKRKAIQVGLDGELVIGKPVWLCKGKSVELGKSKLIEGSGSGKSGESDFECQVLASHEEKGNEVVEVVANVASPHHEAAKKMKKQ